MNKLKYSEDVSLFLCSVLKRLKAFKFETFDDRMKNQKYHYLSQLFQVSPKFNYNLYIKGPYSPDLSDTLFEIYRNKEQIPTDKFVINDLEFNFKKLQNFINNKNLRDLELVTTLYWLIHDAKYKKEEALIKLKEIKSVDEKEHNKSIKLLEELENELTKIEKIK
ncbi:MAG: hypothetical protein PHO87_06340 [Acholeplasmataceae bacterium]|nr:hypothetical protein [Acholeplasmataceae bacterium]